MPVCPRCGKPEFPTSPETSCYDEDCYWKGNTGRGEPLLTEPDEVVEAEFIPAIDDAQLRLQCFHAVIVACGRSEFSVTLEQARVLYAWIMDNEEQEEPSTIATGEDKCERRRH